MGVGRPAVDLILTGGKIWTENPAQPEAEAVAIAHRQIVFVGSSKDAIGLKEPETKVIDLRGRRVVPGFGDAHVHFYYGGSSLTSVQLRNAKSREEMRDRIAKFAASRAKGEWILLGEWDPQAWDSPALPTHELIDDVTPHNPVFVNRVDAHTMLTNSLAMKLAGVDRNTPDVAGGVIGRDAQGNPTGIVIDAAKSLIERVIPKPTVPQLAEALYAAQQHAFKFGVTAVHDMGFVGSRAAESSADLFRAYQSLLATGKLKIRTTLYTPLPQWQKLANLGVQACFGNDTMQIGGLKGFSDGSLGSSTAWFLQPYTDDATSVGGPSDELSDPAEMRRNLFGGDAAGLQLAIHAIGDRANQIMLDTFEEISLSNGTRDRRFRIEHAQHLQPADVARFPLMKVIASMQPYHCIDDGRWACGRIGKARAKEAWAFRSLLDAGATLAFGSDWWVAPIDPLAGIYAAVTRRPIDGSSPEGWIPEQKISVREAVHAYTMGTAYAAFQDRIKGSIEAGKLADLAILSRDIFAIDPVELADTKVELTIVGGEVVYARDGLGSAAKG
ncbi:MAG TPA: amidohydrolase [Terriglobales bacterium]|nr:amidohydrolase [Terriglobales bacterium]